MSFDAIIFDLDKTAVPGVINGMPSQKLVSTVKKYQDSIKLCAATGRSWPHTKKIVQALQLKYPCIVSGGTAIVDPSTETLIWQELTSVDTARQIIEVAKKYPYKVSYSSGLEVTPTQSPKDISIIVPVSTLYIIDIPPGQAVSNITNELERIAGITISKAGAWYLKDGVDLHITGHKATKEHAVNELCKMLDISKKNVAGVGDGFNDIHLFNAVGHKVAMGNAVPELKAVADEIIDSLDNDGLALFIERSAIAPS